VGSEGRRRENLKARVGSLGYGRRKSLGREGQEGGCAVGYWAPGRVAQDQQTGSPALGKVKMV